MNRCIKHKHIYLYMPIHTHTCPYVRISAHTCPYIPIQNCTVTNITIEYYMGPYIFHYTTLHRSNRTIPYRIHICSIDFLYWYMHVWLWSQLASIPTEGTSFTPVKKKTTSPEPLEVAKGTTDRSLQEDVLQTYQNSCCMICAYAAYIYIWYSWNSCITLGCIRKHWLEKNADLQRFNVSCLLWNSHVSSTNMWVALLSLLVHRKPWCNYTSEAVEKQLEN